MALGQSGLSLVLGISKPKKYQNISITGNMFMTINVINRPGVAVDVLQIESKYKTIFK